jgi:predicted metal-binding protein
VKRHSSKIINKKKMPIKKTRLSDQELCDLAKKKSGVIEVCIISPAEVETAAWVRLKCQFGCGGYGQCLVCPPFTPSPQEMRKVLDAYKRAILIHFEPEADVKAVVAEIERNIFLQGFWKAFSLGAGPCYFCKRCPVEDGECQHSEKARPAMEACGIDVFSTVRKFGFPLEVVRTTQKCPNYYGLILVD